MPAFVICTTTGCSRRLRSTTTSSPHRRCDIRRVRRLVATMPRSRTHHRHSDRRPSVDLRNDKAGCCHYATRRHHEFQATFSIRLHGGKGRAVQSGGDPERHGGRRWVAMSSAGELRRLHEETDTRTYPGIVPGVLCNAHPSVGVRPGQKFQRKAPTVTLTSCATNQARSLLSFVTTPQCNLSYGEFH